MKKKKKKKMGPVIGRKEREEEANEFKFPAACFEYLNI